MVEEGTEITILLLTLLHADAASYECVTTCVRVLPTLKKDFAPVTFALFVADLSIAFLQILPGETG